MRFTRASESEANEYKGQTIPARARDKARKIDRPAAIIALSDSNFTGRLDRGYLDVFHPPRLGSRVAKFGGATLS